MVNRKTVRVASRGSHLALWQSEHVAETLRTAHPNIEVTIDIVRTTGDRILDVPLAKIGDRGLFTKELDEAMLDLRADLAVHSLKDIPTSIPELLHLAAVTARQDPRDALIGPAGNHVRLDDLPQGGRVGTSSLRRRAQLKAARPDLQILDLRGNVDTRLRKLDDGEYDAIILAAAGVKRLGWENRISEILDPTVCLPAVGQGALGIVCREDDSHTCELLNAIHDPETSAAVTAERAFLRSLEGGCQVPIGGHATVADGTLTLRGLVADLVGDVVLRGAVEGPVEDAERIGLDLAQQLINQGANTLLEQVRAEVEGVESSSR